MHRGCREFSQVNNLFGFGLGASSISTLPSPRLLCLNSKMLNPLVPAGALNKPKAGEMIELLSRLPLFTQ